MGFKYERGAQALAATLSCLALIGCGGGGGGGSETSSGSSIGTGTGTAQSAPSKNSSGLKTSVGSNSSSAVSATPALTDAEETPSLEVPSSGATAASTTADMSAACKTVYATNSAFALLKTLVVDPIASLVLPAKNAAYSEPAYKTCVTRVTNHNTDGLPGYARNDYSRRQAFNSDSTYQLIYAIDGFWHLYDARTHAHLKQLQGPAGDPSRNGAPPIPS